MSEKIDLDDKEVDIKEKVLYAYNYENIITIINGEDKESPFRFSLKILFFRLLYYNFGEKNEDTYKKFVNFDFKGRKIYFREQFKDDREFVITIEKILKYCKCCLEDYNKDNISKDLLLEPENYNLISKIYYNLSDTSISVISNVSQKLNFITDEENKKICENTELILKGNEEIFTYTFSKLKFYYLSRLVEKLKIILENEQKVLGEFKYSNKMFNEKTLGIFIYVLRICFISVIKEEKDNCQSFYKFFVDKENEEEKILNILNNSYIPGFDSLFGLQNGKYDENYFDNNNFGTNGKILILLLWFYYIHIYFILLC